MSQQQIAVPVVDWECKEQAALSVLDKALETFSPLKALACFSSGIDSSVSTRIASKHPAIKDALMVDTQTGVPACQTYVRDRCAEWGLDLQIRRSHVDFLDVCRRYGILGKGHHATYFNNLKGRVFRQVGYDYAPTTADRVLLVSGVRSQESQRRKNNVRPFKDDAMEARLAWVAPIHDWSKLECRLYLEREGIPTNPVADILHRSGECNCPAFMDEQQTAELLAWFPEMKPVLDAAMQAAKEGGKWDQYGVPVPAWFDRDEADLSTFCEPEACRDCVSRQPTERQTEGGA